VKNFKVTNLNNGITIVSENVPYVKSFSLGFWFFVGSRDENEENNGISHFLEHMFFKGTKKRTANKIAQDIESLGGYLNAFTTKEHTCYYGRGLSEHLENTFEVLSDMIQNSIFRQSEINREAKVIVDELYDIEDSPEELIFDKLETSIYENNPLSFPIIGAEKNIKSFSTDDFINFINDYYTADNFYIAASGNINHDELVKYARKYLTKSFAGKSRKRDLAVKFNIENHFHCKELQQSHFIIACPTYGFESEKRSHVNILSHILGEGSSSRLFQRLREKNGITYQINSFVNSFSEVSTFGVYFSTNDDSAEKAQELMQKEFAKLRDKKVPEKELKKAKEYIKGNLLMSLESTTNRMFRLAHSQMYLGRIKSVEESIAEIEKVSVSDILKIANEILTPDKMSVIILSSKNHLIHSAA